MRSARRCGASCVGVWIRIDIVEFYAIKSIFNEYSLKGIFTTVNKKGARLQVSGVSFRDGVLLVDLFKIRDGRMLGSIDFLEHFEVRVSDEPDYLTFGNPQNQTV